MGNLKQKTQHLMNSDQEKLNSLLRRLADREATPLTAEETQWLEDFRSRYPFFPISPVTVGEEPSLRDVVTAPSREALARMRGDEEVSRFDDFYPAEKGPATPSTNDAIDDFLNTYGHQSQEEDQLLERLIFNPVPDYAQQLAREEERSLPEITPDSDASPDTPEARLNRFILSHHPGARPPLHSSPMTSHQVATEDAKEGINECAKEGGSSCRSGAKDEKIVAKQTPPEGLLSESLAKIYIKTRRYEQAYEILNGLSLRFPEKSSYFADQLRFLRKLILNERRLRIENQSKNNPNP